jgi:hypothetical protein
MTRLYVVVEGQTEESFVKQVLAPHLQQVDVWAATMVVETSRDTFGRKRRGGGRWKQWARDLARLMRQQSGHDVRFTTMFDLYGLPDDFPELDVHGAVRDTSLRASLLEAAMGRSVGDHRFVPYLQRHEFEALVLAALDSLAKLLEDVEEDVAGIASLRELLRHVTPEDIDDGTMTAPSKRLEAAVPTYRKTVHGPLAVWAAGLPLLRSRCPRFDAWLRKLEVMGRPSP